MDIIYAPLHIDLDLKHPIFTQKDLLINLDEFNPTQGTISTPKCSTSY